MGVIGRICPQCGDPFTTNRADRHYCSDDCRNGPNLTTRSEVNRRSGLHFAK